MAPDTVAVMPLGELFWLSLMAMGPIRAITTFSVVGEDHAAQEVRALEARAAALVAGAVLVTVLIGTGVQGPGGISFPLLIAAGSVALFTLSPQALLAPLAAGSIRGRRRQRPSPVRPGLFPPIAVAVL